MVPTRARRICVRRVKGLSRRAGGPQLPEPVGDRRSQPFGARVDRVHAAAADPENSGACQRACRLRLITTSDAARVEFGVVNRSPDEMRAQGPNDGFDFWKFGHDRSYRARGERSTGGDARAPSG